MHSHPLVEIHFVQMTEGLKPIDRVAHWYHVPRIGDDVEIGDQNGPAGSYVNGRVRKVLWREIEGDVQVIVE